jgi:hypothetical protein
MVQLRLVAVVAVLVWAAACGGSKSPGQRDSGVDSGADSGGSSSEAGGDRGGSGGGSDGPGTDHVTGGGGADAAADRGDSGAAGGAGAGGGAGGATDASGFDASGTDAAPDGPAAADAPADVPSAGGDAADAPALVDAGADAGPTCGPCNTPPTACHAQLGTCVQGRCEYMFVEGALCDDANPCTIDDTCTGGACVGSPKICDGPPAPACVSSTDLRTYDSPGVCNGGLCVYTKRTLTCATTCSGAACQTDPCASVTCNAPPSVCYGATGACQQGSCSYPFADNVGCDDSNACTDNDVCNAGVCRGTPKLCASPPADTCENAFTARVYDRVGSCSGGACSYPFHFLSCATGCTAGACNPTGWQPMTSNTNQMLWSVWGSSASAVWAVGEQGTAIFFNGTTWQARPTPTEVATLRLRSVHGTAANNVFAIGQGTLIHYDGAQWSFVAKPFPNGSFSPYCVAAFGSDAYAWGPNSQATAAMLVWVSNVSPGPPTVTTLGSMPSAGFNSLNGCVLQVFSPTDIVLTSTQTVHFDGTNITAIGGTMPSQNSESLFATGDNDIFIMPHAQLWTGGPAWMGLNTGLNGTLHNLSGTDTTRLFAAGESFSTNPSQGTVLRWDGLGWTVEPIPAATQALFGVWAAPTGEVFAVGVGGAVIRGP